MNLPKIINIPEVKSSFPSLLKNIKPTVVYKLSSTISKKIFNYKEFVTNLDIRNFINDNTIFPCFCENSAFTDHQHHQIISEDLRIVQCNALQRILTKGPKSSLHQSIG